MFLTLEELGDTRQAALPGCSVSPNMGRLENPRHVIPKELSGETNPAASVAPGVRVFYAVGAPKETSLTEASAGDDAENGPTAAGRDGGDRGPHPSPPEGSGQGPLGLPFPSAAANGDRAA